MASPSDPAEIAASAIVPTTGQPATLEALPPRATTVRGQSLIVESTSATEAELDDIELAIDNPPPKPDVLGMLISVLGAVALIAKTIASPIDRFGPKDWTVILASAALAGVLIYRYIHAILAKTPLKDQAKRHIRRLREAQGWPSSATETSNWGRLREVLWAKVFDYLSHKKP